MKKILLIMCACLMGALSGARAWTNVVPEAGRAYYLHCTVYPNQFWGASKTNGNYYVTSDLSKAVPVCVESINGTTFAMSFYSDGTKYYLHQHDGDINWPTSSSTMEVPGDANGYAVRNDSYSEGPLWDRKSGHRYMWPYENEGGISFGKVLDESAGPDYCWQFVPVEEVMVANGWEEVTSLPTSNGDLGKYYYIFRETQADLMLGEELGTGKGGDAQEDQLTGVYRYPSNPDLDNTKVWILEYNETNSYGIRNLSNPQLLLQSRENAPWRVQAAWERMQSEWTQWGFTYEDSKWSIQNKLPSEKGGGDNNWIGPWSTDAFQDNMVVAGNAGGNGNKKGLFKIFRKSRQSYEKISYDYASGTAANPLDVSGLMANAKFDQVTAGWNITGARANAFNTDYKAFEAYHRVGGINQSLTNLPNGHYIVSVQVACRDDNAEKTAENLPKLTATPASGPVSAVCNEEPKDNFGNTAKAMSEDADYGKISVDVHVTDGNLTIALTESNNNTWPVYANFTLLYYVTTVASMAEALPANGAMTAGQWYYFDTPVASNYDFTATTLSDIVYTDNGDDNYYGEFTNHFDAKNNALAKKRYYVKSTTDQTLAWSYSDQADITGLIVNPGFEGSYESLEPRPSDNRDIYKPEGWTAVWENGDSNDMTSLNSSCTQWNNFAEMPQPADGGNNVYWIRYRWGEKSSITLKQTILGLPAGLYELGAEGYLSNATNGKATLSAKFGDEEVALIDFTAAAWTKKSVIFSISEAQNVEILYNLTENAQVEIKAGVDNFTLTHHLVASTEDYAALNAAIATAEGKTLGFEEGEYAPYNNIEALQALADAKAISQTAINTKSFVQGATAALTGATWTANAEEVNAVWDGSFNYDYRATTPSGNVNPYGWQRVKDAAADGYNVRYMDGDNAGLAATSSHKALFTKQSAYYGYADGYTMPLKANTVYKVTFVYGGWGDCKNDGYVSMTDPNGNAVTLSATDLPVDATDADAKPESWKTYTAYFTTGEAGNYVLGLRKKSHDTSGQSQYVYGDIVLKKSEGVNLKVANGKLGTFVAPFDVTLPAGVKGYRVASVTETEIKLALIAVGGNELTAGTPLIVYGDGADVDETFYGIPTETENVKAGSLYGILNEYDKTVPAGAYVLQTQGDVQAFYRVAAAAPGALNRCYVAAPVPTGARLTISIEDDPTAITAIEAAEAEEGALKDGKYIIDNKVVIVKNGVKYGANGQKLN